MEPVWVVLGLLVLLAASVLFIYVVSRGLGPPGPVEAGPFLSGGLPLEHAVSRFHVRWYAVAMVFLAFDMEMVFMYPWALVVAEVGTAAVVEMFVFLGLLMAGVVYAWREGAFRWA